MAYIGNVCHCIDKEFRRFSSTNDYINKAQCNSVILDGSISQGEIERMIDNPYMLVVSKMTKKDQQSILLHF